MAKRQIEAIVSRLDMTVLRLETIVSCHDATTLFLCISVGTFMNHVDDSSIETNITHIYTYASDKSYDFNTADKMKLLLFMPCFLKLN